MKLVVDTNVLLSALLWNGNESRAWKSIERGAHTNFTSEELLAELENVLNEKFPDTPKEKREAFIQSVQEHSTHIPLGRVGREDDRHVIALAQHADADYIFTGDKQLRRHSPVPAISAKQLLTRG